MRYLKFENIDGAEQRSRELWEEKLGRPKKEEDESEFMYGWEVSESDQGGSYLLIEDDGMILSDEEKLALEPEQSYQDWREQYQPESVQTEREELESMYEALKLGLSDYVEKNNFKKVLVGLSGGIDSALTATIAVDSLTSDNVIGVAMPSKFNHESSLKDAQDLAKSLNIKLKTINYNYFS